MQRASVYIQYTQYWCAVNPFSRGREIQPVNLWQHANGMLFRPGSGGVGMRFHLFAREMGGAEALEMGLYLGS